MNDVLIIHPYREHGIWRFDDSRFGLRGEPFVGPINDMIDRMVEDARIRNATSGFTAYFSSQPLPGQHMVMRYIEGEATGGTWYYCPQYADDEGKPLVGWLCPAMRHYFGVSPKCIYVRAESVGLSLWERICPMLRRSHV